MSTKCLITEHYPHYSACCDVDYKNKLIPKILSSLLHVGTVWFVFMDGCAAAITTWGQPVLRGHELSHRRALHSMNVKHGCHCWPVFLTRRKSWRGD